MQAHSESRVAGGQRDAADSRRYIAVQETSSRAELIPVGEVIEATTTRLMAQCPPARLHSPPAFGAFVKILPPGVRPEPAAAEEPIAEPDDPFADPPAPTSRSTLTNAPDGALYALVYCAATSGAEPGRRPAAYGLDEFQLREEQPQIFDLLATQFEALHVAYVEGDRLRSALPPQPPRLHAFVYECDAGEIRALTDLPDLLRLILAAPGPAHADQLAAACLRAAYDCHNRDFAFLVRAGKQLANLLRDDPERLAALLRNLEP